MCSPELVVGRISPQRERELEQLRDATGGAVVFHRGVSDETYAALLDDRALLATLSLDEGYGLPIAEALAFGVPAVVSDSEIFREVAGEGALYVPATDPNAFASAVTQLEDPVTRARTIAAGLEPSRRFSWERTAQQLLRTARGEEFDAA